jgi:hypothetical protein
MLLWHRSLLIVAASAAGLRVLAEEGDELTSTDGSLRRGTWTRGDRKYGRYQLKHYDPSISSMAMPDDFFRMVNGAAKDSLDVYEFGVYTGSRLREFGRRLHGFRKMYGFDSFTGFPEEKARIPGTPKEWVAGRDSASDALGVHDARTLLRQIRAFIGPPRNDSRHLTFVQGFYNETCTERLLRRHHFQPALLIDLDCDLYVSTIDALRWLVRAQILVPGSYVRYDDWPIVKRIPNASHYGNETRVPLAIVGQPNAAAHAHALYPKRPRPIKLWGQALAHSEVTAAFDLEWRACVPPGEWHMPVLQLVRVGELGRKQFYSSAATAPQGASVRQRQRRGD